MLKLQCLFAWLIPVPLENVSQLFLEVTEEVIICANQRFSPVTTRGLPLPSYFLFLWDSCSLAHKPQGILPYHSPSQDTRIHPGKNVLHPNSKPASIYSTNSFLATMSQSHPACGQGRAKCFIEITLLASMSKLQLDNNCFFKKNLIHFHK